jgi:hypothetical protein
MSEMIRKGDNMKEFTIREAVELAKQLGVNFNTVCFTPEEFLDGLYVELEHGTVNPVTNVTNDDGLATAKIALAHLNENDLYYDKNIGLRAWERALDEFKGCTDEKRIIIV